MTAEKEPAKRKPAFGLAMHVMAGLDPAIHVSRGRG
jgi:hypothetical protein